MGVFDLTGRKALVTGGARGLGAGMAEALARAGAAVMIGDLLEEQGRRTADGIAASGATAGFVPLDVTDDDSWATAVAATISELGGFDLLINNAGVEISSLIVDLDPKDVRLMLDVNILGDEPRAQARVPGHAPGRARRAGRRRGQRVLGRRHHRISRGSAATPRRSRRSIG